MEDVWSDLYVSLFVRPPADAFKDITTRDYVGYATYSQYNYLRPGLVPRIKTARFEKALQIARESGRLTKNNNAIDFGCADGVLLPSLCKHFGHVLGVDNSAKFVDQASALVRQLGLTNVELYCNAGKSFEDVARAIQASGKSYQIAFLLETLEHIGDPAATPRMYEAKVEFVRSLLGLLDEGAGGAVIVSVPCMVGLRFLAKYIIQATLRLHHERLTLPQLLRSSWGGLRSTDDLEPLWKGGHIGFNHIKLERHLRAAFPRMRRWSTLTSEFYLIER